MTVQRLGNNITVVTSRRVVTARGSAQIILLQQDVYDNNMLTRDASEIAVPLGVSREFPESIHIFFCFNFKRKTHLFSKVTAK